MTWFGAGVVVATVVIAFVLRRLFWALIDWMMQNFYGGGDA